MPSSDLGRVTTPLASVPAGKETLATVIPLLAVDRDRATWPAIEVADADARAPLPDEEDRLPRARSVLQRLAGDRAVELPVALGRATLRVERLLTEGPAAVDPSNVDPAGAIATTEWILQATAALFELIEEEGLVLGEVLTIDLSALRLETLVEVAEAVLALSQAPRAVSSWGSAVVAEAAEVVLQVIAEDLRVAARSHAQLSQRFTEGIWYVPGTALEAGRRRWRLISRVRLRRELRAVSRTGHVRGFSAAVQQVLEARTARDRIASMAPLLSHHLAELDRGPLSDADAALTAVGAVRRLQAILGDLLDEDRLAQLLLADAFRSPIVVSPAVRLRNALRAWDADVKSVSGAEAYALTQSELARWAAEVSDLLPALAEGQEAAGLLGAPATTLRALVDMLLVREHVEDLQDADQLRLASLEAMGVS